MHRWFEAGGIMGGKEGEMRLHASGRVGNKAAYIREG